MANIGTFDADLRSGMWFDPTALYLGWFAFAMPFSHDLIDSGVVSVFVPRITVYVS